MAEQANGKSGSDAAPELKSVDAFKSMSLKDMEAELTSKDYSQYQSTEDQSQQTSETSEDSDETSDEQENAAASDQTSTETETSSDSEETGDDNNSDSETVAETKTDKQNKESLEDRFSKLEKNYKELQGEFTRRSQKLKEVEAELAKASKAPSAEKDENPNQSRKKNTKLSQLQENDPEAYEALKEAIDEQVNARIKEQLKPVEDAVTLRTRQDNANRFNKASDEFLASPLGQLEAELVSIINENPAEWQRTIWENDNAFEMLKKELIYRHTDKVAKLLNQAEKNKQSSSTKKDRLNNSQVATKTKVTQATKDVMSSEDFRKLSLAEMEKRLPKVR